MLHYQLYTQLKAMFIIRKVTSMFANQKFTVKFFDQYNFSISWGFFKIEVACRPFVSSSFPSSKHWTINTTALTDNTQTLSMLHPINSAIWFSFYLFMWEKVKLTTVLTKISKLFEKFHLFETLQFPFWNTALPFKAMHGKTLLKYIENSVIAFSLQFHKLANKIKSVNTQ
jgi:hypothetical protein